MGDGARADRSPLLAPRRHDAPQGPTQAAGAEALAGRSLPLPTTTSTWPRRPPLPYVATEAGSRQSLVRPKHNYLDKLLDIWVHIEPIWISPDIWAGHR